MQLGGEEVVVVTRWKDVLDLTGCRLNLRVTLSGLATVLAAIPVASQAQQRPWVGSVEARPVVQQEQEVRNAVSAFGRAYARADTTALRTMLTRDYLHVNGGSGRVLGRREWLSWVGARRPAIDSGALIIDTYRVQDVEVRVHGATALVTGIVESRGSERGAPFSSRVRFTNVWIREDGQWLRAMFHDSPMPQGSDRG